MRVLLVITMCCLSTVRAISRSARALEHEFPSIVSIQQWWNTRYITRCSGSLLNRYTVLTASTCWWHNLADLRVVAGTIFLSKAKQNRIARVISQITYLPNVTKVPRYNLMVLKLDKAIEEDKDVKYARLVHRYHLLPPICKVH